VKLFSVSATLTFNLLSDSSKVNIIRKFSAVLRPYNRLTYIAMKMKASR